MCQRAGVLIGWDYGQSRAVVARANCDCWTCDECAARMRQNWKMRAAIGVNAMKQANDFVDFCTITSHEALPSFSQTCYVFRKAWPVLYAYVKRRRADLQYMIVPEKHEDGRMHVHVLWNAGTTQRQLKDNARIRGLGHQCDVSAIGDVRNAVFYVSKYLSKNLGADVPPKFRRVRVSQNWPDVAKPDNSDSVLKWEFTRNEQVVLSWMAECQAKHIFMVDQKTKQAFDLDDIDFSLID